MKLSGKLFKCKVCFKNKQLNEFYIHKSGKQKGTRTTCTCILCTKNIKSEYRATNKEAIKKYRESFYTKQEEEYFEKEKIRKYEWSKSNPDKVKESNRNFRQSNKGLVASYTAKYRADKLKRAPKWLSNKDLADIKSIYKMCNKISEKTGTKHHADHIIPLRGEKVSGLHVPSNLRVITDLENLIKGNNYEVD